MLDIYNKNDDYFGLKEFEANRKKRESAANKNGATVDLQKAKRGRPRKSEAEKTEDEKSKKNEKEQKMKRTTTRVTRTVSVKEENLGDMNNAEQKQDCNCKRYMRTKDLASYLNFSQQWISKMSQANKIPHFLIGGSILFDKYEIDAWVHSFRVK